MLPVEVSIKGFKENTDKYVGMASQGVPVVIVDDNGKVHARMGFVQASTARQDRAEALELVASYAKDLVEMWPTITLRTLHKATSKIADLKEALLLMK